MKTGGSPVCWMCRTRRPRWRTWSGGRRRRSFSRRSAWVYGGVGDRGDRSGGLAESVSVGNCGDDLAVGGVRRRRSAGTADPEAGAPAAVGFEGGYGSAGFGFGGYRGIVVLPGGLRAAGVAPASQPAMPVVLLAFLPRSGNLATAGMPTRMLAWPAKSRRYNNCGRISPAGPWRAASTIDVAAVGSGLISIILAPLFFAKGIRPAAGCTRADVP